MGQDHQENRVARIAVCISGLRFRRTAISATDAMAKNGVPMIDRQFRYRLERRSSPCSRAGMSWFAPGLRTSMEANALRNTRKRSVGSHPLLLARIEPAVRARHQLIQGYFTPRRRNSEGEPDPHYIQSSCLRLELRPFAHFSQALLENFPRPARKEYTPQSIH